MPSTFSINQVRHLYVVNDVMKTTPALLAAPKDFTVKAVGDDARFHYMNSNSEVVGSDMISKKSIMTATQSVPKMKLTKYTVTPETPVVGKEYIVRITVFGWGTPSRESQYYIFTSAVATSTVKADLVAELNSNLQKTLAQSEVPCIKSEVSGDTLVITELEQKHIPGRKPVDSIDFTVQLSPISTPTDSQHIWGTVVKANTVIAKNGKMISDLEYFCLGARGDIYRKVGFPYVIDTDYLIDPALNYMLIDIAYSYQGVGMNNQNSDKVITLAVPYDESAGAKTKVNAIIDSINTALGTSIVKVPTA